jgi:hypothetical protein
VSMRAAVMRRIKAMGSEPGPAPAE